MIVVLEVVEGSRHAELVNEEVEFFLGAGCGVDCFGTLCFGELDATDGDRGGTWRAIAQNCRA